LGYRQELQAQAKKQKLGKWAAGDSFPAEHLRNVDWSPDELALYNKYKGQPLDAVIEEVREGTTIRCQVQAPNTAGINTMMFWLHLSGVQSRPMPKPISVQEAEYNNQRVRNGPFQPLNPSSPQFLCAREAKKFTQKRLLHMSVKIILDACIEKPLPRNGGVVTTLYGRVDFNGRDIAHLLLREGHSRVIEWHMNPDIQRYEQMEEYARQNKKGIWKENQPEVSLHKTTFFTRT
jgi:staphylococcal nuclease domain-containing protein 1